MKITKEDIEKAKSVFEGYKPNKDAILICLNCGTAIKPLRKQKCKCGKQDFTNQG